jgi:hypothetical protein
LIDYLPHEATKHLQYHNLVPRLAVQPAPAALKPSFTILRQGSSRSLRATGGHHAQPAPFDI